MVALADLPWTIHLEDARVWQRERTTLMVEVQSDDRFATLEASLPRIEGVDVQAIPASNEEGADGNRILRLGWQLFPHTSGRLELQLPEIHYHRNGRDIAQWQAPPQMLEVKALPPYLPPTLPVGKVDIASSLEPAGLLLPGHLAYWQVSLSSNSVTTAQFPPILRQVQVAQGVETFPATVKQVAGDDGIFRLDYRIPFKPQGNGRLDLPVLQWHWFDPASGRLEQVQHTPPRPWVLGWVWRSVLGVSGSLLLLASLLKAGAIARRYLHRWYRKQQVLRVLANDVDPQAVRQAMQACALAHDWPDNFSSAQWLRQWEQVYGQEPALQAAIQRLDKRRWMAGSVRWEIHSDSSCK